jgi:CRP/FNR family transcriptional regulator, nitrogen fixation regulation protein
MAFKPIARRTAFWFKENSAMGRRKGFATSSHLSSKNAEKLAPNKEISMFVNVNARPGSMPKALGELGELSRARVIQSEFKYGRGMEIYGQDEPADYIYQVADGAVRSYKLLSDGRRQIGAFHLVGDIFGLENGATHRFTAEAVVDTTVRLVRRRSLEHVAESDVLVALDLLNMTTSNLQHAEDHMLLLGRKTSLERVAAFLLEMDRRLTASGVMALPMSRRDIADYLGLTLETVSRALSYLHGKGVLGFLGQTQRQIVLLDRARLAELDL